MRPKNVKNMYKILRYPFKAVVCGAASLTLGVELVWATGDSLENTVCVLTAPQVFLFLVSTPG